jgi:translation initiation factor IF-2
MTKENNTTRSTLTLKLKTATPDLAAVALKNTDNKKVSSSSVQVTIKGRRKEAKSDNDANSSLNKSELEARMSAISRSEKDVDKNPQSHKAVSEIIKEKQLEEETQKAKSRKKTKEVVREEEPVESLEIKAEEEVVVIIEPKEEKIVLAQPAPVSTTMDSFDIRSKIRQSIDSTNRQKEERDKIVETRKKEEQERLEKERIEKDKKKVKKFGSPAPFAPAKAFDSDDGLKKGKPGFKQNERVNTRKLTTYVIDENSDDGFGGGYRKKRHKNKQVQLEQSQKEYKKVSREVLLPELITIADLADRMTEKTGDVVKKLFTMGMVVTSNQVIDADTAELIIGEFGHTAKRVSHSDVENVLDDNVEENLEQLPRAPIVTIMGHVDHGKTSLLDALRETDVAKGEHGGITQHIGASRIKTKDGKYITFLDTPGHEAFTEMRLRGANVTDIVILVVAADDGVKEQTIEAINHAKAANVPIIVAVNKIDKPGANPQVVKNELLSHGIIAEELGGDAMFVNVSAKAKTNLDKLEEIILLQAEMLDLKAPYVGRSSGVVIESRVDAGKGVVATLLVQKGTLDVADLIVVGTSYGRVRKLSDEVGKNIKSATPSMAVEVLGLDQAPSAGDKFMEVIEERQAREIISYRARKEKEEKAMKNSAKSLANIFKESGKGNLKHLNVIVKADVNGSAEAINGSLLKLNTEEVAIKVVHMATGGINESDINLAAASNTIIIGFNVRANAAAKEMARVKGVDIRYYSIIYNLVDDMKLLLSGMLEPTKNEEYLGQAEIRQVFKVSGSGKIAGAYVTDGLLRRNARIRLLRDNVVIHDAVLKTLKRFKEDAKEVKSGFECGFSIENYEDIKEKDTIECYEIVEKKRVL